MNVALTRARVALWVLGNAQVREALMPYVPKAVRAPVKRLWAMNLGKTPELSHEARANLKVQRASASEGRRPSSRQDHEDDTMATVLLYGKVDQQEFTMDYQQPLSTVQAFAACLSSWAW